MKKAFGLILIISTALSAIAQSKRYTGATFNATTIAATPKKIGLSLRSFQSMPPAYTLEPWCPTPGNQGNHGTCVAFANGYGIGTILYAKHHNITDKTIIDKYAYSATHLYERIKSADDKDCQFGSDPIKALWLMADSGNALNRTVPYVCGTHISQQAKDEAPNYKIKDATILFAAKGMLTTDMFVVEPQMAIDLTKKALLEGTPVSTGFHLPESFFSIKTDVWYTSAADTLSDWKHNGHAMAIVGYDDNKAGGAFRVLNSWGTGWADKGYVWIRYKDFTKWCVLAMQVFGSDYTPMPEELKPKPAPDPAPQPQPEPAPKPAPKPEPKPEPEFITVLNGSVEFKLNTGEDMPVTKISSRNLVVEEDGATYKEDLVAYTMMNSYNSGTKFRFYLNTETEAYIYAFATDLSGKINRILPYDDITSTHVGSNTVIAFPSDTKVIKLDENRGTDYLLILFSKEKININELMQAMNNVKGGLSQKIITALGSKLVAKEKINYDPVKTAFQLQGKGSRNLTVADEAAALIGSVVPLMVEIKHQ